MLADGKPSISAIVAVIMGLVLVASACGGDDDAAEGEAAAEADVEAAGESGVDTSEQTDPAAAEADVEAAGETGADTSEQAAPDDQGEPIESVESTAPAAPAPIEGHPITIGEPCVLRLHGNNGSGGIDPDAQHNGPYYAGGAITLLDPVSPTVTSQNTWWEFDGPYGEYSDDDVAYQALAEFLTDHVDTYDCGPILVWGLSGGATMAVNLYCRGEDFDGRAWGYYFADPPVDESVIGCSPPDTDGLRTWFVQSEEFITTATTYVQEGEGLCPVHEWGWYCEDGQAMLPGEYYQHLGMEPLAVAGSHLEALLAGTPTEFNMWDQVENWYAEYDPTIFEP